MPNGAKKADNKDAEPQSSLPFEAALKKLESIVEAMESEEMPLEALLKNYQEGTELARLCQDKLAEADLKVQQLEKAASGDLTAKPLPDFLDEDQDSR